MKGISQLTGGANNLWAGAGSAVRNPKFAGKPC